MKMFRFAGVMCAGVLLICGSAWGWYPFDEKYNRWQKGRPMRMGAHHNSVPRDCLDERIARFKAAGLNTFFWPKSTRAVHYFRAAGKVGLDWQCGIRGKRMSFLKSPKYQQAIREVLKIPGCTVVRVMDEPSFHNKTEEQKEQLLQELKGRMDWVKRNYPDLITYVNLSIGEIDVERYVRTCQPDTFEFDWYPLLRDGTLGEHYLYAVNLGRKTARKHRIPYWMSLQAYGRPEEKPSYAYRIPDEADVRFLVFTFLAHGGTGMRFYIYYGYPESMVEDSGVKEPGREPSANHRYENTYMTRAWFAVRDVAPEVQNLATALLNLRPKGEVGYVGNGLLWDYRPPGWRFYKPATPWRNRRFGGQGALKSVRVLEEQNLGAMVGFFDDQGGQEYFMVVNLQHGKNMSKMDGLRSVRLVFDKSVEKIERLNRVTGRVEVLRTKGGRGRRTLDVRLEGGTGDLFKCSNGKPWALR